MVFHILRRGEKEKSLKEYMEKYRKLLDRGICAHAALCHVVSYSYMRGKELGLSLDEADRIAQALIREIQGNWEKV